MDDLGRFPIRKHPRMGWYDYRTANTYFVTICTWQKRCLFGRPCTLNPAGRWADVGFGQIPVHFPGVTVEKWVVMPNHVHALVTLTGDGASLSNVVGQYKSFVSRKIHGSCPELRVWQTSFHDHVVRNQQDYQRIWAYIDGNPSNWEKDCFYLAAGE